MLGRAYRADLTELPGLDDLAWPSGVLQREEALLAEGHRADGAAMCVGGASTGIMAAILAHVAPGQTLLFPRDSHRSVYGGAVLARARPRYAAVVRDPMTGYAVGWGTEERSTRVRLAVVPYPTYPGVVFPLRPAWLDRAAVVVADAAHGALYGLDPALPVHPLDAGADIAVIGCHKSGVALTQAAAVVWRGRRVDAAALRRTLRLLQTTSPSYLLLMSLAADRAFRQTGAAARLRRLMDALAALRRQSPYPVWQVPAGVVQDPFRMVLLADGLPGGQALAARLRQRGIEPEHADAVSVWLAAGLGTRSRDVQRVLSALREIAAARPPGGGLPPPFPPPTRLPAQALRPADALRPGLRSEDVPMSAAVGRVAADWIAPYPPGTPWVVPGEVLDHGVLDSLRGLLATGATVHGVQEGGILRVLAEPVGQRAAGGRQK
jgi:arginine/lysine/ornithine decarboxylase